jgi:regulator of sirC expression with transglutaminase-like and TPR domain
MNRRLVAGAVGCVILCACGRAEPPSPLTDALLSAAHEWGTGAERDALARSELDQITGRIRERMHSAPASSALARVVFDEFGFVREVEDESLEYVLLPKVLERRRGSCVGLGSLYLALAEKLGLRMHGVLLPGHFFVVLEENGTPRAIELLHRGEVMPEGWHQRRFGAPAAPAYNRALTRAELLGILEFNVGNQRRRAGLLHQAQRAFERARRHFPDFAEAHASAGAVAHLLGSFDASFEAYQAAQRVNPDLPGLASNLALLEAERER